MNNRANHWQSLDKAIHQWWFLGLLMLPELLPPFASRGYVLSEWGAVNAFIITHPIKVDFSGFYLVFQIIPLTIVIAAFIFREKVSRLFGAYVCLSYGLIAFLQSISISQTWGVAVCTGNLVVFLFL